MDMFRNALSDMKPEPEQGVCSMQTYWGRILSPVLIKRRKKDVRHLIRKINPRVRMQQEIMAMGKRLTASSNSSGDNLKTMLSVVETAQIVLPVRSVIRKAHLTACIEMCRTNSRSRGSNNASGLHATGRYINRQIIKQTNPQRKLLQSNRNNEIAHIVNLAVAYGCGYGGSFSL